MPPPVMIEGPVPRTVAAMVSVVLGATLTVEAALKLTDCPVLLEPRVTLPSSSVSPPTVCVPFNATVYVPVAFVPAEKTAVPPDVHPVVALAPVESELQKLSVPHVPGAFPPASSVAPALVLFMSQYKLCP